MQASRRPSPGLVSAQIFSTARGGNFCWGHNERLSQRERRPKPTPPDSVVGISMPLTTNVPCTPHRAPADVAAGALAAIVTAGGVTGPQALVPRAFEISARVAFSASLTCTPPMPRNPPSDDASATFLLIVCSHALNPAASCGALALT